MSHIFINMIFYTLKIETQCGWFPLRTCHLQNSTPTGILELKLSASVFLFSYRHTFTNPVKQVLFVKYLVRNFTLTINTIT